jgi:hypothetical protein
MSKPWPILALALAMALLCSACSLLQAPEPLPTEIPTATLTPTATVVWFPPTETPTPRPTVEVSPTPNPRDLAGSLILKDDFAHPANWSLASSENSSAAIANQHLTLALSKVRGYLFTTRKSPYLGDFYAEVTVEVNLCRGADEYGLLLRAESATSYYRFVLTCNGSARVERLLRGVLGLLVPPIYNGAVTSGAPSISKIAVWAQDNLIDFYVNDQYLFTMKDTAFPGGSIGFFVRTRGEDPISVNFSQLELYQTTP